MVVVECRKRSVPVETQVLRLFIRRVVLYDVLGWPVFDLLSKCEVTDRTRYREKEWWAVTRTVVRP